jgi:hypothetical protein
MRRRIGCGVAALIGIAVVVLTRGPADPAANPRGAFAFAVLGDAPYYVWEDLQFRLVLHDLDAHDLTSIVSVGDIFWRPCTDEMYQRSLDWFNGLRHPVIYTPGDNEWFDCWEAGSGGYKPQERLARLRQIFFSPPTQSMGRRKIQLVSQPELMENARWLEHGIVFTSVHLIGSGNGWKPFPGRTPVDDADVKVRTEAATAWLTDAFTEAKKSNAWAVAVFLHGNPFKEATGFEPFLSALRVEAARFGKPVLVAHGSDHQFVVDHPIPNVTRLEVPGSPDVGWVRVVVTAGAATPFAFERRVIPRWKYW